MILHQLDTLSQICHGSLMSTDDCADAVCLQLDEAEEDQMASAGGQQQDPPESTAAEAEEEDDDDEEPSKVSCASWMTVKLSSDALK